MAGDVCVWVIRVWPLSVDRVLCVVLCYAVLYCVVLCVMLCCAVLCVICCMVSLVLQGGGAKACWYAVPCN